MKRPRIFFLSPASSSGERARLVFNPHARFPVAEALRTPEGAPLGEVFTFLSGLYFRGKLAYGRRFERPPAGVPGTVVITPSEGLVSPDARVDLALVKIEAGTYGVCERCGNPIPKARLKALPYAALCVACKSGGLSRR